MPTITSGTRTSPKMRSSTSSSVFGSIVTQRQSGEKLLTVGIS